MIKNKFVRICAALVAVVVAGIAYAAFAPRSDFKTNSLAISASAADISYEMTAKYKSGRFYKNLTSLTLSGDGARDVVAIAMSQLGYHEGNSTDDLHGESTSGTRDFVEYNVLYGKLDNGQGNGMSYGYYWCASFVNWCLRQANIPESATAGAEVSCQRWFSDCKDAGIYRSKSGYVPTLGDIIFFKDKGSAVDSTHVGLVRYSDGNYVYTVEGNTSNGSEYSSNGEYVALKSHALSSSYIVGYATPKYGENETHHRVDPSGGFFSSGDYIAETELSLFADSALSINSGNIIPPHTAFTVNEVGDGYLKVTCDGVEGYLGENEPVLQITSTEDVYVINYLNDNGAQMYMPQYRRAGQARSVYSNTPTREKSGFVGWSTSVGASSVLLPGDKLPEYGGDITLRAIWDTNFYVVTFNDADGTVIEQISGYYGTKYSIPTPPTAPEGFVFYGWGGDADGVIRGNASYTAEFISEEELNAAFTTETEAQAVSRSGCSSSIGGAAVTVTASLFVALLSFKRKKH